MSFAATLTRAIRLLLSLGTLAFAPWAAAEEPASPSAASRPSAAFHGQAFDIGDPATGGRGGQIYLEHCAACHDAGVDRAPVRNVFPYMSPQSILQALSAGAMSAQGEALSGDDKKAVAEFLSGHKLGAQAAAVEPPACRGRARDFDFGDPPGLLGWGFEPSNRRYVPAALAQLNPASARKLHLKWALAFPNALQARSQPALAGGALFVGSHNGEVYALDRETGCARWIFQAGAEVRTGIVVAPWRAGDRSARPLIYFGDIVGDVFALDGRSGRLVWRIKVDAHPAATITGAPTLYQDTLFVPVSSLEGVRAADPHYACCTFRGSVVALNAATGAVRWRTFMTPPSTSRRGAPGAVERFAPSGAPVWGAPTIDPKRQRLYVGTGNSYSSPASDRSDALIALNLRTGVVAWVYEATKHDATNLACVSPQRNNCPSEDGPDSDFGAAPMLVTTPGGRDLVIGGQKAGVVVALEPANGRPVWRVKVGRGGLLGGVHFGMAANPRLIFAPVNDAPDGRRHSAPPHPGVYALDVSSGRLVWSSPADLSRCGGATGCWGGYSQAITATDDLVFAGAVDGQLQILDGRTGAMVWKADTTRIVGTVAGRPGAGGSFGGGSGPVVYRGELFVSSGYSLAGSRPGALLLAFSSR